MAFRSLKSTREILAHLTTGSGASKLAPNVSKIALTLAIKGKNDSAGAKHFLHEELPRIQYNNPNVEFEVIKKTDATITPTVTVEFGTQGSKTIAIPRMASETICQQVFDAKP